MSTHLAQASGAGRIEINGHGAPATYLLTARSGGRGKLEVDVEVTLPRDWLLEKGFDARATLERENGKTVVVKAGGKLAQDAPLSIRLSETIRTEADESQLADLYPEFEKH